MKFNSRLSPFIMLLLFFLQGRSQELPVNFRLVTGAKGASLGKITSIAQDKFGYIWLVDQSNQNVVRYDGYRMKIYRNIKDDTTSLHGWGLEAIAADTSGNVWVGNLDGVDKISPREDKIRHYYFPAGRKSGYVLNLLVDHLGIIWIGTADGLYSLDEKTGKFTQYTNKPDDTTSISCNMVYTIYEDRQGELWIATGWPFGQYIFNLSCGGLNKFNRKTGTFTRYMHDPKNPRTLINNVVRAIYEDSRGVFWVGTKGDGLHIMDRKKGTFERLTYDPSDPGKLSRLPVKKNNSFDHIPFITEDGTGAIWIGTYSEGLVRFDPETKKVTRFRGESRPNGFDDSTAWCALKSRDGALWIATEQSKLFRVDPVVSRFTYRNIDAYSWFFLEDTPGVMWVGTFSSGLFKIDKRIPGKENITNYLIEPGDQQGVGVNAICPADSRKYWAATFRGIYKFDPRTGKFENSGLFDKKHDKPITALSIAKDKINNTVYITGIGFHVLDPANNSLTDYWNDPKDTTSISADTLVVTIQDKAGNFWITTKNAGINYFNRNTKKFTRHLGGLIVYSAFIDAHETVWAGTDYGLYKKVKDSISFSQVVTAIPEFTYASVTALTSDDNGNIWGSSSLGIFRIHPYKNEFCIYGRNYGITAINTAMKTDAIKTSDGKIYFGAFYGFYTFNPKEVVNDVKPEIILTGLKIDGSPVSVDTNGVLKQPIEETQQIELAHNRNNFSIDFAAIHYSNPEENIHQYMLEGYENVWRDVGVEKTAYYFYIPPGDYTFRIRAISSYGMNAAKSLRIIVLPPWWQTWWAYCLYGLIAISAVWAFIRWRTARLKKENIILEEKVAARTRELIATQSQLIAEKEAKLIADFNQKFSESELKALRAQMNPHFVFNILNTIESYALDNNKEAASMMIQKFSRLTRMVLENSMNQLVPLKNDLKALQLYIELEQMRYTDKFLVKYNIDREMLEEDYLVPPMIIQPFVENAILHGLRNKPNNNGILHVSASLRESYIVVAVEDNGIGRKRSAQLKINNPIQRKSLGIDVTQDRIAIFNNLNQTRKARVEIHDLSEGTRVIIQLPVPV